MKIYKITPLHTSFFDMGGIGKCSVLYIQAENEDDARAFALLNKQTSTVQDIIPGQEPSMFENMFNKDNAKCINLSEEQSQELEINDDLGFNLVCIEKI